VRVTRATDRVDEQKVSIAARGETQAGCTVTGIGSQGTALNQGRAADRSLSLDGQEPKQGGDCSIEKQHPIGPKRCGR